MTKQSRGKLSQFSLNRKSFPVEYITRLGIYHYKKLLLQKFSRRIFIFALTVKVFPLECFIVYGSTMLNKNTLGVKKVRGQSEASHNGYISDQKL